MEGSDSEFEDEDFDAFVEVDAAVSDIGLSVRGSIRSWLKWTMKSWTTTVSCWIYSSRTVHVFELKWLGRLYKHSGVPSSSIFSSERYCKSLGTASLHSTASQLA